MAPLIYRGSRLIGAASVVGLLGVALSGVGFAVAPDRMAFAWLSALGAAVSLALGALVFLLGVHTAGAEWPVAVRRLAEGIAGAFPVLALAFIPVALNAARLYIWVDPPESLDEHLRHLIEHKRPYLEPSFFVVRAGLYFAVWIFVRLMLRRWSFAGDTGASGAHDATARAFSAAMLPLVGLTATFAAFDWLMSLEPAWLSSIYGLSWIAGGFVASLGLIALLARGADEGGVIEGLTPSHFHALGRLLFAFSIFWAYLAFFQTLLIELPDLPEEVTHDLRRRGQWTAVGWIVVAARFVVPFFLLLPRAMKRDARVLAVLGVVALVGHCVDGYRLVMPVHSPAATPSWTDLAALAALGGLGVAHCAWRLRGRALVPLGDARLARALAYRSPS